MSISIFARLNHRFGKPVDLEARRRFMIAGAAAVGATLLSGPSFSQAQAQRVGAGKRVLIVGAGFSGLSAAYELKSVGYDVTVIDVRDRVSGRVLSFNDHLKQPFIPGKNVEGGGELIGSNHPCWVHYAQTFGLEFLDLTVSELEAPIYIDGKKLGEEESNKLWAEMDLVFNRMNDDARNINADAAWTSPDAARLDKMSVKDWLDQQKDLSPLTRRACDIQLSSDNGAEIAQQSYLGLLACIKGHDLERYWSDSEVYRCKGGNQQLAEKLADAVGRERIILGLAVNAIEAKRDGVVVTCRDGRTIQVDDVIVTAPAPTWSKISFSPGLPPAMKPQMGTNLKWLAHQKHRIWKDQNVAPDSMTDTFLSQTWEGTDAQEGDDNVSLNCFSGGAAAQKSLDLPRGERDAAYKKVIDSLYPGAAADNVASRYMDWPRDPWTGGGYSFPAPGQVTTVGPLLRKGVGDRIHFAGEHTSYAFVGYMEGGLNSGTGAARRLALRDGLKVPEIPMPPAPEKEKATTEPATTEPITEMKPDAPTTTVTETKPGPIKVPATTQTSGAAAATLPATTTPALQAVP